MDADRTIVLDLDDALVAELEALGWIERHDDGEWWLSEEGHQALTEAFLARRRQLNADDTETAPASIADDGTDAP